MTDLAAAAQFIAGSARLLERRRFGYFEGDGSSEAVVRALDAYRNADGGIGHLEPDIRTPASQPTCVLYALEILHEVEAGDLSLGYARSRLARDGDVDDGGVPFILETAKGWPMAPWFAQGRHVGVVADDHRGHRRPGPSARARASVARPRDRVLLGAHRRRR